MNGSPFRLALLTPAIALLAACGHHHMAPPPVSPTESPALEQQADQEAHASVPDGQRVPNALHGVAFGDNQFTDWNVPLESNRCYWFGYAADPGVQRFSMYVWNTSNRRVETARNRGREGVIEYCPSWNGVYRIQGKVMSGAGHFAVVAYAKGSAAAPPPPPAPVAAPPPPAPALDLAASIERQAASAAPGASRVGEFFSATAETSDWFTSMDAGKCYWIIGAGEPGRVKKLFLYLWDPRMARITENRSDSDTAMVGYCAKEPGMYKFQAKVYSGSGPYKVGVYVK